MSFWKTYRFRRTKPKPKAKMVRLYRQPRLSPELKIVDTEASSLSLIQAWQIKSLCDVKQGVDFNNRSGQRINIRSIEMRGEIQNLSASDHVVRVVLMFDNSDMESTAPIAADLFDVSASTNPTLLPRQLVTANYKVFKVFYDKRVVVNPNNQDNSTKLLYYKKRYKGKKIASYSGNGELSWQAGLPFLFICQRDNTVSEVEYKIFFRIRYTDV